MSNTTILPEGVRLVRTTPTFDAVTVPTALLSAHRIADGVWGRLIVDEGVVDFVFEHEPEGARPLAEGVHQVIPPGVLHHIALGDGARFRIEFHR